MRKNTIVKAITVLIMSVLIFSVVNVGVHAQTDDDVPVFSIVWVTDTQHLSGNYPAYYDSLCNWIVDNSETYNVKMVIHTGDFVDWEDNPSEWAVANNSISLLLNNSIPYCWDAGNHDYTSSCWIGNQYTSFNSTVMQQKSYWVSQTGEGRSTAVWFNVSGWECLIVNLAYHADQDTLDWAENLITAYPSTHVIVATHAYIDEKCHYDSWAINLRTMLDRCPNVFLTLSGHYHFPSVVANRTQTGDRDELFFNMQEEANQMGGASARILTFNAEAETISVQTYLAYSGQFLTDESNNFTLTTNFQNDSVLFVLPEYSYGVLMSVVACFGALAGFTALKIRKEKTCNLRL
jgi:hypothetical protein